MNADILDIISQIKAVRDVIISRYMMGKILASTFALMVGMTVFSKIFDKYSRCNTGHIRSVCKEYEEGRMNGSFCKRLCSKDVSKVYQKCLSSTCDKIVYEIDFDGMPLVVKYQNIPETEKTGNGEWNIFSTFNNSDWSVLYYGHCGGIFAVESVEYPAGKLFGSSERLADLIFLPDALDNVAELLGNLFSKFDIFSHISSSLYSLYPYTSKFLFRFFHQIRVPLFKEKIEFMKNLFMMLETFLISTKGKILMCDIHLDNFGLTKSSQVKVIDGDHIFFVDDVTEMLSRKPCVENEDCRIGDFDDCHSYCNVTTKLCIGPTMFSNIRNFCVVVINLVLDSLSDSQLAFLQKPYRIIQKCASNYSQTFFEELNKARTIIDSFKAIDVH